MISKNITVNLAKDSKERPVAKLVQTAIKYECHIDIESSGRKVNAKSIIGVMSLPLFQGHTVTVYADGADENAAIEDIEGYLSA